MQNGNGKMMILLSTLVFTVCTVSASAQQQTQNLPHYTNFDLPFKGQSTITTLYSLDPLASSLCFADGNEGGVIQSGGVFNRCSHINFDHFNAGSLTVAIEGGELGSIVDLGSADDLKKEYGYAETGGNGQGFASIIFRDGKVRIRKAGKQGELQELVEGGQLFQQPLHSSASSIAKPAHIYLTRIVDRHNKDFQIMVKLLVLKATPGESVTFRWELL
jgi:hypothetical protein